MAASRRTTRSSAMRSPLFQYFSDSLDTGRQGCLLRRQCSLWVISGHLHLQKLHVRFTPESDIKCDTGKCPLWAKSGHPTLWSLAHFRPTVPSPGPLRSTVILSILPVNLNGGL